MVNLMPVRSAHTNSAEWLVGAALAAARELEQREPVKVSNVLAVISKQAW